MPLTQQYCVNDRYRGSRDVLSMASGPARVVRRAVRADDQYRVAGARRRFRAHRDHRHVGGRAGRMGLRVVEAGRVLRRGRVASNRCAGLRMGEVSRPGRRVEAGGTGEPTRAVPARRPRLRSGLRAPGSGTAVPGRHDEVARAHLRAVRPPGRWTGRDRKRRCGQLEDGSARHDGDARVGASRAGAGLRHCGHG